MEWNVIGLVASLSQSAGIEPDTYYCNNITTSATDQTSCSYGTGGGGGSSVPIVTAPPIYSPIPQTGPVTDVDPTVQNTPIVTNPLPVSNPGSVMSVPVSTPVTPTPISPANVASANPWLIGLLLAGGLYYVTKNKKGARNG